MRPSSPTVRRTPKASLRVINARTRLIAKAVDAPSSKKMMVDKATTKALWLDGMPPVTMRSWMWSSLCLKKYTISFTSCAPKPARITAAITLFILFNREVVVYISFGVSLGCVCFGYVAVHVLISKY